MALRRALTPGLRGLIYTKPTLPSTTLSPSHTRIITQLRAHATKGPSGRAKHSHYAAGSVSGPSSMTRASTTAAMSPPVMSSIPQLAVNTEPVVDGMPRWPTLTSAGGVLRSLDWLGTVSFAHSGAVLAASMGMDLLGTAAVGTITAVGGGTIRDALFLAKSPFWTEEVEYLLLCAATGIATFLFWPKVEPDVPQEHPALFAGDTLGVAAFCVIGAQNGIRAGMPFPVSVLCGMATATFGGAVRDVLCKRDVRIFHSHAEIYATTAAGGATAYLVARMTGAPLAVKLAAGLGTAGALRYMAWKDGIRLPVWEKKHNE